jgi:hypothetical protein
VTAAIVDRTGQPAGGSGDLDACETAPGDDRSFKVSRKLGGPNPGHITVDSVTVTTDAVPPVTTTYTPPSYSVDYTNPNKPEVTFANPPTGPGAPAKNTDVCADCTTQNEGNFDGKITW